MNQTGPEWELELARPHDMRLALAPWQQRCQEIIGFLGGDTNTRASGLSKILISGGIRDEGARNGVSAIGC